MTYKKIIYIFIISIAGLTACNNSFSEKPESKETDIIKNDTKKNDKTMNNTSAILKNHLKSFNYNTTSRRDPFKPLPIPAFQKIEAKKEEPIKTIPQENEKQKVDEEKNIKVIEKNPDIIIQGITWDFENPVVMFKNNDRIYKEGMSIDNSGKVIIKKINIDNIILEKNDAGIVTTKCIKINENN
ncbi:hypothetical protein HY745_13165 [Candidatus Desantisbacteria bacterium]|nr:hypothetical protein [Candidatus Desantisbacteria bacterium]